MSRFVVFSSLVLGWISYYVCQRTLPSAIALMVPERTHAVDTDHNDTGVVTTGFSKGDLGKLQSCFAIAYAMSIFINGFLSDRLNPKFLFGFGLMTSSTLCLLFPLTEGNIILSCVVWFLFGLFQGCGWPSSAKLLRLWFSSEELGTWWSILSCSSNFSSSLIRYFMSQATNWRHCFHAIGATTLFLSIPILYNIHCPPSKNSVMSKEPSSGKEVETVTSNSHLRVEPSKTLPWYGAFLVFDLWVVALLYVPWWLAKGSVLDWGQLYLEEFVKLPKENAATIMSIMELGSMFGKLTVGTLSVWLIRYCKMTYQEWSSASVRFTMIFVIAITLMVLLCSLGTYTPEDDNTLWLIWVLFVGIGAAVDSGKSLSSLSSMEVVSKELSGSALGIVLATGQVVGRSIAGWPFSQMVEVVGWNRAYQLVGTSYILTIGLSGYLMVTFSNNLYEKRHKQR